MGYPVVLSVDDGTTVVAMPACAAKNHRITGRDTRTGYGEIEYTSGRARRWSQFRRRTWNFEASGVAASGLEALDLTKDYWTATFRDPLNPGTPTDPDGTQLVVTVVPFVPIESYSQPSAEHTASITLRETIEP